MSYGQASKVEEQYANYLKELDDKIQTKYKDNMSSL